MAKKFYVVWQGRKTGIFNDWATCKQQIEKFSGAQYKSFPTLDEAQEAFSGSSSSNSTAKSASGTTASGTKKRSNTNGVKTYTAKEIDAMDMNTKIYTDGGCEPNPGKAGSGIAVYRDEIIDELWYGLFNSYGTNNTAELNALHYAMRIADHESKQGKSIAIFCDSKYSIQCITQWAAGWQKKGWKKPSGEIKNLELIKQMFALYSAIKSKVQILHVNGHVGVEGNELADRMSIIAIDKKEEGFKLYNEDKSKPIDLKVLLSLRNG